VLRKNSNTLFSLNVYLSGFWARSQNCVKRLLASSCPSVHLSVRPDGTTLLPLGAFSWSFIFEYFS